MVPEFLHLFYPTLQFFGQFDIPRRVRRSTGGSSLSNLTGSNTVPRPIRPQSTTSANRNNVPSQHTRSLSRCNNMDTNFLSNHPTSTRTSLFTPQSQYISCNNQGTLGQGDIVQHHPNASTRSSVTSTDSGLPPLSPRFKPTMGHSKAVDMDMFRPIRPHNNNENTVPTSAVSSSSSSSTTSPSSHPTLHPHRIPPSLPRSSHPLPPPSIPPPPVTPPARHASTNTSVNLLRYPSSYAEYIPTMGVSLPLINTAEPDLSTSFNDDTDVEIDDDNDESPLHNPTESPIFRSNTLPHNQRLLPPLVGRTQGTTAANTDAATHRLPISAVPSRTSPGPAPSPQSTDPIMDGGRHSSMTQSRTSISGTLTPSSAIDTCRTSLPPGATITGLAAKLADVYACGVVGFMLLVGRPPFNGPDKPHIYESIYEGKLDFERSPKTEIISPAFVAASHAATHATLTACLRPNARLFADHQAAVNLGGDIAGHHNIYNTNNNPSNSEYWAQPVHSVPIMGHNSGQRLDTSTPSPRITRPPLASSAPGIPLIPSPPNHESIAPPISQQGLAYGSNPFVSHDIQSLLINPVGGNIHHRDSSTSSATLSPRRHPFSPPSPSTSSANSSIENHESAHIHSSLTAGKISQQPGPTSTIDNHKHCVSSGLASSAHPDTIPTLPDAEVRNEDGSISKYNERHRPSAPLSSSSISPGDFGHQIRRVHTRSRSALFNMSPLEGNRPTHRGRQPPTSPSGLIIKEYHDSQSTIRNTASVPRVSAGAKCLISSLLQPEPSIRPTALGALEHPWLKQDLDPCLAFPFSRHARNTGYTSSVPPMDEVDGHQSCPSRSTRPHDDDGKSRCPGNSLCLDAPSLNTQARHYGTIDGYMHNVIAWIEDFMNRKDVQRFHMDKDKASRHVNQPTSSRGEGPRGLYPSPSSSSSSHPSSLFMSELNDTQTPLKPDLSSIRRTSFSSSVDSTDEAVTATAKRQGKSSDDECDESLVIDPTTGKATVQKGPTNNTSPIFKPPLLQSHFTQPHTTFCRSGLTHHDNIAPLPNKTASVGPVSSGIADSPKESTKTLPCLPDAPPSLPFVVTRPELTPPTFQLPSVLITDPKAIPILRPHANVFERTVIAQRHRMRLAVEAFPSSLRPQICHMYPIPTPFPSLALRSRRRVSPKPVVGGAIPNAQLTIAARARAASALTYSVEQHALILSQLPSMYLSLTHSTPFALSPHTPSSKTKATKDTKGLGRTNLGHDLVSEAISARESAISVHLTDTPLSTHARPSEPDPRAKVLVNNVSSLRPRQQLTKVASPTAHSHDSPPRRQAPSSHLSAATAPTMLHNNTSTESDTSRTIISGINGESDVDISHDTTRQEHKDKLLTKRITSYELSVTPIGLWPSLCNPSQQKTTIPETNQRGASSDMISSKGTTSHAEAKKYDTNQAMVEEGDGSGIETIVSAAIDPFAAVILPNAALSSLDGSRDQDAGSFTSIENDNEGDNVGYMGNEDGLVCSTCSDPEGIRILDGSLQKTKMTPLPDYLNVRFNDEAIVHEPLRPSPPSSPTFLSPTVFNFPSPSTSCPSSSSGSLPLLPYSRPVLLPPARGLRSRCDRSTRLDAFKSFTNLSKPVPYPTSLHRSTDSSPSDSDNITTKFPTDQFTAEWERIAHSEEIQRAYRLRLRAYQVKNVDFILQFCADHHTALELLLNLLKPEDAFERKLLLEEMHAIEDAFERYYELPLDFGYDYHNYQLQVEKHRQGLLTTRPSMPLLEAIPRLSYMPWLTYVPSTPFIHSTRSPRVSDEELMTQQLIASRPFWLPEGSKLRPLHKRRMFDKHTSTMASKQEQKRRCVFLLESVIYHDVRMRELLTKHVGHNNTRPSALFHLSAADILKMALYNDYGPVRAALQVDNTMSTGEITSLPEHILPCHVLPSTSKALIPSSKFAPYATYYDHTGKFSRNQSYAHQQLAINVDDGRNALQSNSLSHPIVLSVSAYGGCPHVLAIYGNIDIHVDQYVDVTIPHGHIINGILHAMGQSAHQTPLQLKPWDPEEWYACYSLGVDTEPDELGGESLFPLHSEKVEVEDTGDDHEDTMDEHRPHIFTPALLPAFFATMTIFRRTMMHALARSRRIVQLASLIYFKYSNAAQSTNYNMLHSILSVQSIPTPGSSPSPTSTPTSTSSVSVVSQLRQILPAPLLSVFDNTPPLTLDASLLVQDLLSVENVQSRFQAEEKLIDRIKKGELLNPFVKRLPSLPPSSLSPSSSPPTFPLPSPLLPNPLQLTDLPSPLTDLTKAIAISALSEVTSTVSPAPATTLSPLFPSSLNLVIDKVSESSLAPLEVNEISAYMHSCGLNEQDTASLLSLFVSGGLTRDVICLPELDTDELASVLYEYARHLPSSGEIGTHDGSRNKAFLDTAKKVFHPSIALRPSIASLHSLVFEHDRQREMALLSEGVIRANCPQPIIVSSSSNSQQPIPGDIPGGSTVGETVTLSTSTSQPSYSGSSNPANQEKSSPSFVSSNPQCPISTTSAATIGPCITFRSLCLVLALGSLGGPIDRSSSVTNLRDSFSYLDVQKRGKISATDLLTAINQGMTVNEWSSISPVVSTAIQTHLGTEVERKYTKTDSNHSTRDSDDRFAVEQLAVNSLQPTRPVLSSLLRTSPFPPLSLTAAKLLVKLGDADGDGFIGWDDWQFAMGMDPGTQAKHAAQEERTNAIATQLAQTKAILIKATLDKS